MTCKDDRIHKIDIGKQTPADLGFVTLIITTTLKCIHTTNSLLRN